MEKTPIIYFYYAAKSQKKGTSYTSKCKRFLKLMTLWKIKAQNSKKLLFTLHI